MARGKILRNRILSMLVSLALSFCLWLALSGQDTTTIELTVPLELTNLPDDLVIKSEVPASVIFQVSANTAQLRFLADRKPYLWIDVSAAYEGPGNVVPIPLDSLDLPRGVQVRKAVPTVIEFETARLSQKTVPVKPSLIGQPNEAFLIKSMTISPQELVVQGPVERLADLDFISTTAINIEGLSANADIIVFPAPADLEPGLTVSVNEITASFKVEEKILQATFRNIPIEIDLKSESAVVRENLEISPATAEIAVYWPASRGKPVKAEDVRALASVDGEKLKNSGDRTEVSVVAVPPAGVSVSSINPGSTVIKYIRPVETKSGNFSSHGQQLSGESADDGGLAVGQPKTRE